MTTSVRVNFLEKKLLKNAFISLNENKPKKRTFKNALCVYPGHDKRDGFVLDFQRQTRRTFEQL
jgi:hypothetical protein